MIRLVALDIDGTLLAPGVHFDALPEEPIKQAVHDLHEAGVVVVLATGRMFPGTASVARHLGIDRPLICQQGASVHEADGRLRHGCAIDEEIAHELIDYAETHGWPLAWFDSERYLVTEHTSEAQFFADVSRVEMEVHPQPHRTGVRATGIDIISSRQHSSDIHVLLEARYGGRITLLDFPSVTAVHAPDASKGNALHTLAEELGIARDEVLAIGDSVNDVSMLSWAGHSAAPEHCDRYARDSAREILPGSGVDGVAARLRSIVD
ncbi:MAG: HAD-IIB family hydrolase [Gammaproteobacteria bacterium]|nr:HAD-IIB family hydrolase [Gammaproteobacteria bacterium]